MPQSKEDSRAQDSELQVQKKTSAERVLGSQWVPFPEQDGAAADRAVGRFQASTGSRRKKNHILRSQRRQCLMTQELQQLSSDGRFNLYAGVTFILTLAMPGGNLEFMKREVIITAIMLMVTKS